MSAHRDLYPQADPQWLSFMDDIERMSQERSLFGAICTIFYEATCFGGDLGPNGNCLSGTDEGIVNTQAFFDRWVRRVAETVYAEDEERKVIGRELRKMASGPCCPGWPRWWGWSSRDVLGTIWHITPCTAWQIS